MITVCLILGTLGVAIITLLIVYLRKVGRLDRRLDAIARLAHREYDRGHNAGQEHLKNHLLQRGWTDEPIQHGAVPVPDERTETTLRDAFYQLQLAMDQLDRARPEDRFQFGRDIGIEDAYAAVEATLSARGMDPETVEAILDSVVLILGTQPGSAWEKHDDPEQNR